MTVAPPFLAAFFRGRFTPRCPGFPSGALGAGLLRRIGPGRNRIALPPGRRRNLVAAHHQRRRPDRGAAADPRRGQRDAMRAQRRAVLEDHGVHPHDPVVEQMRLHHTAPVDRAAAFQRHQIRLRAASRSRTTPRGRSWRPMPAATGSSPGSRSRRGRTTVRPPSRRRCPTPRCATRTMTTAGTRRPGSGRPQAISRPPPTRRPPPRRPAAPRRRPVPPSRNRSATQAPAAPPAPRRRSRRSPSPGSADRSPPPSA